MACIVHGYGGNLLILLNKPFRVLSQFRDRDDRATLADFVDVPNVYPAGLLDAAIVLTELNLAVHVIET